MSDACQLPIENLKSQIGNAVLVSSCLCGKKTQQKREARKDLPLIASLPLLAQSRSRERLLGGHCPYLVLIITESLAKIELSTKKRKKVRFLVEYAIFAGTTLISDFSS